MGGRNGILTGYSIMESMSCDVCESVLCSAWDGLRYDNRLSSGELPDTISSPTRRSSAGSNKLDADSGSGSYSTHSSSPSVLGGTKRTTQDRSVGPRSRLPATERLTWRRDLHPRLTSPEFQRLLRRPNIFPGVELDRRHGPETERIASNAWPFPLHAVFAFLRIAKFHACGGSAK